MILKNFWYTLRTYRQSTLFNVMGLTLAFAACYIIFVQTSYELRFGRVHEDYERIHRVNVVMPNSSIGTAALSDNVVKEVMDLSPLVEHSTLLNVMWRSPISYDNGTSKEITQYELLATDTCLNDVFDMKMVVGRFDDIASGTGAAVPLSMAENLWGDAEGAMGKRIYVYDKEYSVVAVYEDFPKLSVVPNKAFYKRNDQAGAFNGFNGVQYFKVTPSASESDIEQLMKDVRNNAAIPDEFREMDFQFTHTPLIRVYFEPMSFVSHPTGNSTVSYSLLFIVGVILVIALVNFVNFSTAIAPRRIKAINTYRVLGHSPIGLRLMLTMEAVLTVGIALTICFFLLIGIADTNMLSIIPTDVALGENLDVVVLMLVIGFVMGVITGLYPAIYMTSFTPALVLNGGRALPQTTQWLRPVLLSFQYIISIAMIIVALFISKQTEYALNMDCGYNSDNLLTFDVSENARQIAEELSKEAGVIEISTSGENMLEASDYQVNIGGFKQNENTPYEFMYVSYNYPQLMGLDIFEGEDFVEADQYAKGDYRYALLNERAKEEYNAQIGDRIEKQGIQIKGFFRDIHHSTVYEPITPLMFIVSRTGNGHVLTLRHEAEADVAALRERIHETVEEWNPGEEVTVRSSDMHRSIVYSKERNLKQFVSWAALAAIFIAIIGVVGLIALEAEQRKHEIAIRKVHGATVKDILLMLNKRFIRLVFISYLIAVPLAWYVVHTWLQEFEYRITLTPWEFILAGVLVLGLTVALVTAQSYKAAMINPTKAMK